MKLIDSNVGRYGELAPDHGVIDAHYPSMEEIPVRVGIG
jgi:hypothetical protein